LVLTGNMWKTTANAKSKVVCSLWRNADMNTH